jgi:hypothetical protein
LTLRFYRGFLGRHAGHWRFRFARRLVLPLLRLRMGMGGGPVNPVVEASEDHFARRGLSTLVTRRRWSSDHFLALSTTTIMPSSKYDTLVKFLPL